ncbi:hypothetical protein AZH53_04000 [Methanomicrobiaceae archaeon CYW5]|uniref:PAS domain S-box protein n=1 Tax=Methanovulcanius yangii TaxID=1789227 RepID=UPI0029C9D604|nr:PAS domain S-box protein [Methanovulcanius yangii]MBT8507583.1 hypothetical protein [Methanovulcanius yangii]
MLISPDGAILAMNSRMAERFGRTPDALIDGNAFEIHPPELANLENIILQGNHLANTLFFYHESADGRHYKNTINPVVNPESEEVSYAVFSEDMTEKLTKGNFPVREKTTRLASIVESAEDAIIATDTEGRITIWNHAAEATFGYTEDEALGKDIDLISPPDYGPGPKLLTERVKNGEKVRHFTTKRMRKDGTVIDVSLTVSPITGDADEIVGISYITRDISDVAGARRKQKERDEWNAAVLRSIGDTVITTDTDGKVTFMNPAAEELTGWTFEEARNKPLADIYRIAHDGGELIHRPDDSLQKEREVPTPGTNIILTAKDGTTRPIDDVSTSLSDGDGGMNGAVLVSRDISGRRAVERRLEDSVSKFRALFASNGVPMVEIDGEGTILLANPGFETLSGVRSTEVDGRLKLADFLDTSCLSPVQETTEGEDPGPFPAHGTHEFVFTDRLGTSHDILMVTGPVDGSDHAICTLIDISDQKTAEQDLRRKVTDLSAILNSVPYAIVHRDRDLNILWENTAAKAMDAAIPATASRKASADGENTGGACTAAEALATGNVLKTSYSLETGAGEGGCRETTFVPIMDSEGTSSSLMELTRDVTPERESREKYALQHTLAERLSAISSVPAAEEIIFESLLDIGGVDAGLLYHADTEGGGLALVRSEGVTDEFTKSVRHLGPERYSVKRLGAKKPIYGMVDDISPNLIDISQYEGVASFACLPIVADDHILGACYLLSHTNTEIPESSRAILESTWYLMATSLTRMHAEEQLKESRERLDMAIQSADLYIMEYTPANGTIKWTNSPLHNLGYSSAGIVDFDWWTSLIHPEDRDERMAHITRSINGDDDVYSAEYRIRAANGEWRWLSVLGKAPDRDGDGKAPHLIGVIQDITPIKENEQSLKVANKKMNLLSSITRHDIINQVTPVLMYLELSRELCTDNATLEGYLEKMEQCVNGINSHISFTKDYQDLGLELPVWQSVIQTVGNVKKDIDLTSLTVDTSAFGEDVEIFADPMFRKTFFSLFDNSVRHGGDISEISIASKKDGGTLNIIYQDDGEGVPSDMKERIFSKGVGKNTGLGLFLTKEILDITGIGIRETGVPGESARFEISVPPGKWRYAGN